METKPNSPHASLAGGPAIQRPLRLLVVEDSADLNLALKSFFRLSGYHAWFAADVASALRLVADLPFDILLSDIGLPDGNGWELRALLVQAGRCPPHTVAMSGFGLAEHAARSKAEGFAYHLVKPFDPDVLLQALAAATCPVGDRRPPADTLRVDPGSRCMVGETCSGSVLA